MAQARNDLITAAAQSQFAYIWVKDADALYEELRSRGVKITRTSETSLTVAEISTWKTTQAISFALDKTWKCIHSGFIDDS